MLATQGDVLRGYEVPDGFMAWHHRYSSVRRGSYDIKLCNALYIMLAPHGLDGRNPSAAAPRSFQLSLQPKGRRPSRVGS